METRSVPTGIFSMLDQTATDSSLTSRRHSSANLRHYASIEFKAPITILSRSITQESDQDWYCGLPPEKPKFCNPLPQIDLKVLELYAKKGRQNSEPGLVRQAPIIAKRFSCGHAADSTAIRDDDTQSKVTEMPRKLSFCRKSQRTEPSAIQTPNPRGQESSEVSKLRCVSSMANGTDSSSSSVTCYRILESVYVGCAKAASSTDLLHRLKIDHLIDLRRCPSAPEGGGNLINHFLPPSSKNVLTARLDQSVTSRTNLENYFQRINSFITGTRLRGKNVLLYDNDGRDEAPAAVVQYLMQYYHMKYTEAKQFVSQIIPDMRIPDVVEKLLECQEDNVKKSPKPPVDRKSLVSVHGRNGTKLGDHPKNLAWA